MPDVTTVRVILPRPQVVRMNNVTTTGGGVTLPITLNPGDVLAQDEDDNTLIGRSGAVSPSPTELLFTSMLTADVQNCQKDDTTNLLNLNAATSDTPENGMGVRFLMGIQDLLGNTQDIGIISAVWYDIDNQKGYLNFAVSTAQVNTMTLWPGSMSIDGADEPGEGYINVTQGYKINDVSLSDVFQMTPSSGPPASPVEGMIYADTDHHLYYYNGTTWKQLDN